MKLKNINIAILNVKGIDFRYILWGISTDEVVNRLNNYVLEEKGVLQMGFGEYKTPIEVIKESVFGRTWFRYILSGVTGKWYKKSWKKFDQLKNINPKFYCTSYYNISVNKCDAKCRTSLRFWENKGWINEIDPYGWFQWSFRNWLGRRSEDDERQITR